MAHALEANPISKLEENLECSMCLEILNEPRTLPCCHSFCKACLERLVQTCRDNADQNGQPLREIPCPNCRLPFTLDHDKQVADMPRNTLICNIIEVAAILNRGIGVPCSHNGCEGYSIARCVTCEKFLCQECLTGHNNYRGNDGHDVLSMEELSRPENRSKIKDKPYCREHKGMSLKVYCETCDMLICRDCMDFKHVKLNHSCRLVSDIANTFAKVLASSNKAMEKTLTESENCLKNLKLKTDRLDQQAAIARKKIALRKDIVLKKITEILDRKTETLLNEVDEIHQSERAKLDKRTKETQIYSESLKRLVCFSNKLVAEGTEEEIISSKKTTLDNTNSLLGKRHVYLKAPVTVAKLSFTPRTTKEPLNEEIEEMIANYLGEVDEV